MNKYKQIVLNSDAIGVLDKIRNKMKLRGTMKASYSQVIFEIERRLKRDSGR